MTRQDPGDFDPRNSMIPPGGCLPPSVVIGALILLAVLGLFLAWPASAHEAPPSQKQPLGWTYGWECCSQMDCKRVDGSAIEEPNAEHPKAYKVMSTGELVPANSTKIKQSKDEDFHWCSHQSGINAGKTICLYIPPRGF